MRRTLPLTTTSAALVALVLGGLAAVPAQADRHHAHHQATSVRFATFNASLNRSADGQLVADLSTTTNVQAQNAAETIQRARPDILLVNEFDFVEGGVAADLFRANYLEVGQRGAEPIHYPYAYVAESNTGIPSGFDLNNDGQVAGGDDAFGFGVFPGQFGMVVYSKYPIDVRRARTFQHFLWKDMPGALLPDNPATPEPADWYSPEELDVFRLPSKSHWDLPIKVHGKTVHFLVSHPTPPVFDGPEDRNGARNFDEIRLWADYIKGGKAARYIYDDEGRRGGLPRGASFVIAGDQNSDPLDGDSIPGAVQQLIEPPRLQDPLPTSDGAVGPQRSRAARTPPTSPTRATTPRTSPTPLRETCGPTTCCRPRICAFGTPRCSGRSRPTRCSG